MQKIIVGLGNPGRKFELTRHNLGELFLEFITKNQGWKKEKKILAKTNKLKNAVLAVPLTYMNESGRAVKKTLRYYGAKDNFLIVHDDSDLLFGKIKYSPKSRSAGHHGIDSITKSLKINYFPRIRIGIRPENLEIKAEKFVLKKFNKQELKQLQEKIFPKALALVNQWLED
jgi:PTH1 family peptidyl-tRNA hydrolase